MKIYISSITSAVQLLTNQTNQLVEALTTQGTSNFEVVDGDTTYNVTLAVGIGGPTPPPVSVVPYGVNVHYGQGSGHADYTTDTIPHAIDLITSMKYNFVRADVTTDDFGEPQNPSWLPFFEAALEANLGIFAVISVTAAGSKAPASGKAGDWSQDEYDQLYKDGFKKGAAFMVRHADKISWVELGNELDVIDDKMKLRSGSGTGEPDAPSGSPLRWTSTYNGDTVLWNMDYYGAYFHFIKGLYNGIKYFSPNTKVGMNYAYIHYGLFMRFYDDMIALNNGAKFDFISLHWYNSDEYSTDTSHNASADAVVMEGEAIDRLRMKFIESGRTDIAGISETGFYKNRSNPDNLTDSEFREKIYGEYWNQSEFFFEYELFNEIKQRAGDDDENSLGLIDPDAEDSDIVDAIMARTPFPRTPVTYGQPRIDPCIAWKLLHPRQCPRADDSCF
ncbi:hypothetical protein [Mucilaginibacter agri]|uniref:Uncharacterized protein n=1 Tax=Mucilaginibacter agri TaxID=2695265 RepID=A0A966DTX9_9SPHI|nr:hypothetical protein [Mucilaginibacter agri]NCD71125.1 hypothetical protein [Mucilaginibacter agri]